MQDGDIIWITDNKIMYDSVEDIDTAVVVDKDDKITTNPTSYDKENIILYHLRTVGINDIGLITNIATGLLNRQSKNPKTLKYIDENVAFLRLAQGKSIDFIKTGFKYKIASYLRKEKKPYFLVYNYSNEKKLYNKIRAKNKIKKKNGQHTEMLNVSMAKSPLNELCWDIEKWERNNFTFGENAWIKDCEDVYELYLNQNTDFNEDNYWIIKDLYIQFNKDYNKIFRLKAGEFGETAKQNFKGRIITLYENYKEKIKQLNIDHNEKVNYCILASYKKDEKDNRKNKSAKFAWAVVGDEMLENLQNNSIWYKNKILVQTTLDDAESKEYLGRYYKFI